MPFSRATLPEFKDDEVTKRVREEAYAVRGKYRYYLSSLEPQVVEAIDILDNRLRWNDMLRYLGRPYTLLDTINYTLASTHVKVVRHLFDRHRLSWEFKQCLVENASKDGNHFMRWALFGPQEMYKQHDPNDPYPQSISQIPKRDQQISEVVDHLLSVARSQEYYLDFSQTVKKTPGRGVVFSLVNGIMKDLDYNPGPGKQTPLQWAMTTARMPRTAAVLVRYGAKIEHQPMPFDHDKNYTPRHTFFEYLFIPPVSGCEFTDQEGHKRLLQTVWNMGVEDVRDSKDMEQLRDKWTTALDKAIKSFHSFGNVGPEHPPMVKDLWDERVWNLESDAVRRVLDTADFIKTTVKGTLSKETERYLAAYDNRLTARPSHRAGRTSGQSKMVLPMQQGQQQVQFPNTQHPSPAQHGAQQRIQPPPAPIPAPTNLQLAAPISGRLQPMTMPTRNRHGEKEGSSSSRQNRNRDAR